MTKHTNSCLIGSRINAQIFVKNGVHAHTVVKLLFGNGIREIRPLLQAKDSKHSLKANE